jgi:hypothetical protein
MECRNFLSVVLPFTDSERAFLDLLLDHGVVDASILTADADLQRRIQTKPLLEWKAINVRKHKGLSLRSRSQTAALPGLHFLPQSPLFLPVQFSDDMAQAPLRDFIAPLIQARQQENFFLNIGRQEKQVHDLGDTGASDAFETSDVGEKINSTFLDQIIIVDCQGHDL